MLTDEELSELTIPIIEIFQKIELDLIEAVAARFDVYDKVGGSLEWQIKKLDELGALNQETAKILAKYSKRSEKEILAMLEKAGYSNLDIPMLTTAFAKGFIPVDPSKIIESEAFKSVLQQSYIEVGKTYKLIKTKALESTRQAYMDILNRAYVETASGIYDYNTSIRNALRDFADKGITAATYRRGNKTVSYSIEGAVRRDTLTAVHQLANRASEVYCTEMGTDYVEVSEHMGARVHPTDPIANHAGWQGKVYKINGSDKKYKNLNESTGYPDDILGLGGVNCRHRMFPFIPGISVPNSHKVDYDENKKYYENTQKQRAMERQIRAIKKRLTVAKASGDKQLTAKYRKQLTAKQNQIEAFCKKNNLRRQTEREMIQEEYKK